MVFSEKDVQCLSAGAHILGGGGGGQKSRGLKTAEDALQIGIVRMVDAADLCDGDILVTVSGVGAPSKKEAMYLTSHYLCALDLLEQQMDLPIAGFIPSEMGASAAFGPFIAAAAKGLPIIDAACDGRAHPLGTMGALGLAADPLYQTMQAACGGRREDGTYIEVFLFGSVAATSQASRMAAGIAGGLATVVRNPVPASYLRSHAAIGCYTTAMELGRTVLSASSPSEKAAAAAQYLSGSVVCAGIITKYELASAMGFDHGYCTVSAKTGEYFLSFFNEFMTLEQAGRRLATFPDLITMLDAATGEPVLTADIQTEKEVILILAPHTSIQLGAGLRYRTEYERVESILDRPLLPYVQSVLKK